MASNSKPRFPLSLSMPSTAPVAADLPPLAREEYLTARNKVAASLARKKQLEASLLSIECELWDAEGAYLNSTSAAHGGTGSVVRGFDAYLKPTPVHAHGRRDRRAGDRQASGGDDDDPDLVQRVFSNSSTTAETSVAQRQADAEAAREKEREARLAERRAARASLTASRAGSPPDSVRERNGTKLTISRASPRAGSPSASARSSPAPSASTPKRPHNESSSTKKRRPPSAAAGEDPAPPRKKKIVARAGSPNGVSGNQALARRGP